MEKSEIEDMFSALGPVTIKRMFGGKGVYCNGSIIAVEFQGDILLKADAVTAPAFEAAGSTQWTYEGRASEGKAGEGKAGEGKAGKPVKMPYWSIPADAFDDPDIMAKWVKLARDAASRSVKPGPKRGKRT
jgi:DNA transformation protein